MYSKILFVFVVLHISFDFSHGQEDQVSFREDYTYIAAEESFYKVHTTEKNWRDAKKECALEGASLYYPENSDEANAVLAFWTLYYNNTKPSNPWVYVGISDIITEGEFETIDGKSISEVYNIWKPDQPDNCGDEDCVHLNMQEGTSFLHYNDISCGTAYSFICKKSFPSLERNCSSDIQQNQQPTLGTPLNIDSDVCFNSHQPDGNHFEECGSMFLTGNLINTDCNMKSMSICEHGVDTSN